MESPRALRHVVLFGFKKTSTPGEVNRIEEEFGKLPALIPLVRGYEWGTNNSPEGLAQGHTHCFLLTFDRAEDRDAYLVHPEHQRFVALLEPHIEAVTVVDYWAR
jgi:hypothetical protein